MAPSPRSPPLHSLSEMARGGGVAGGVVAEQVSSARPASRKARKAADGGGEFKEPKYVLTPEVMQIGDRRYCRVYRRPPISYADLITYAIAQSEHKKLKLNAIYCFLVSTFGYFKFHASRRGLSHAPSPARKKNKNSIRHNLSMKSKGRFLKVKEDDDAEKGSYWHLNRDDAQQFRLAMESAHDTADRLAAWVGIVFYELPAEAEPVADSVLFGDDDPRFTGRLYVFHRARRLRFCPVDWDAAARRRPAFSDDRADFDRPLPPPPLRNLIVLDALAPAADAAVGPVVAADAAPAAAPVRTSVARKRRPSACVESLDLAAGQRQQPLSAAATPASTRTGVAGLPRRTGSETESLRARLMRQRLDSEDSSSMPATPPPPPLAPASRTLEEDDEAHPRPPSGTLAASAVLGGPLPPYLLFEGGGGGGGADSDRSCSNGGGAELGPLPGIDLASLDLGSLMADPSVSADCFQHPWSELHLY
ncbi:Hepatocyte nuclear factor 3-beta [Cladochytrium tenue]|nr:Hepatocyte nuclear factor 3-beta [Cladochytrium tenue]